MQTRWEHLTPPDFTRLAQEEQLCILPIGSLERHGDHMPFGTDAIVAHTIACRAAEQVPCVVFPPYWFGQVHEASCFAGTINFPADLLLKMLETLLDQIAQNGFRKILLFSAHGGNTDFLHFFAMSQLDRHVDYTLYQAFAGTGKHSQALSIWNDPNGGHADERETSMMMAAAPDTVRMDNLHLQEPVNPRNLLSHLEGVHTALWWYAMYPQNVSGSPSFATQEKGEAALRAATDDLIDMLRAIKADTTVPAMQQEFYRRHEDVRKGIS